MRHPHPSRWTWYKRPLHKAWRVAWWDRWSGLICVVIVIGSGFTILGYAHSTNGYAKTAATYGKAIRVAQHSLYTSNIRHHSETSTQNTTIIRGEKIITFGEVLLIDAITDHTATLNEIATLQQQLASVYPLLVALPATYSFLATTAQALNAQLNSICGSVPSCTPITLPPAPPTP